MEYEHVNIGGNIVFADEMDYLRCRMQYLSKCNLASLNISFMEYIEHLRDSGSGANIIGIRPVENRYETIDNFSYTSSMTEYVIDLDLDLDLGNSSLYIDSQNSPLYIDAQNIQDETIEEEIEDIVPHSKVIYEEIKGTIFDKIDLD
ncbi:MAG: hypothetical protein KAH05_00315 [Clostridiales bacterium]|nr:hypothetical protein [Clostridiales bacterium]